MPSSKSSKSLRFWQAALFLGFLAFWHVATSPTLLPPVYFDNPHKAAFFFGEPLKVLERMWVWFSSGTIYPHLWVTLVETALAFVVGTVLGLVMGLWLALSPTASALFDPYIKALNSMPRVILAPIFDVYQGVREVSYTVLANARILGASDRQLLRHVYVPSAMSWVFASLHNSVGLAFVGAVVGEYLGSSRGVGYLILQAEGTFDINSVFAGILVLTAFALLLDWVVSLAERRLLVWQPRGGETEKI